MLLGLLFFQKVSSHSCETLRELQHDPNNEIALKNRPIYGSMLSYLATNASEAGGDLALIQTSQLFSCKCQVVSNLISTITEVWCVPTPASLPLRGQVTKPTTVKRCIIQVLIPCNVVSSHIRKSFHIACCHQCTCLEVCRGSVQEERDGQEEHHLNTLI